MDTSLINARRSQSTANDLALLASSHCIFYIHFHFPCSVMEISQEPRAVWNIFSVRHRIITSVGETMLSSSKHPQGVFPGQIPSGNRRLELYSIEIGRIAMKSKIKLCRLQRRIFTALWKWESRLKKHRVAVVSSVAPSLGQQDLTCRSCWPTSILHLVSWCFFSFIYFFLLSSSFYICYGWPQLVSHSWVSAGRMTIGGLGNIKAKAFGLYLHIWNWGLILHCCIHRCWAGGGDRMDMMANTCSFVVTDQGGVKIWQLERVEGHCYVWPLIYLWSDFRLEVAIVNKIETVSSSGSSKNMAAAKHRETLFCIMPHLDLEWITVWSLRPDI